MLTLSKTWRKGGAVIKKIFFVFLISFSIALAKPAPIDKYRKVHGIRFFGDDANSTLFYYLPKQFRIKENQDGSKAFRFYFNTATQIHYCDCSMTLEVLWPTVEELEQSKGELGAQTFQKAPIQKMFLEHVGGENSEVWRHLVDVYIPPYLHLDDLTAWFSSGEGIDVSYRIPGFACQQIALSYRDGFGGFQRGLALGVIAEGVQIFSKDIWAEVDMKGFFERQRHREVKKEGVKVRWGKLGINWKWMWKEEVREWVTTNYDFVDYVTFNLGYVYDGVEADIFSKLYEKIALFLSETSRNEDLVRLITSEQEGRLDVNTRSRFTLPPDMRDFSFLINIPFQEATINGDCFKGTEDIFQYEWQNYLENQSLTFE